MAEAGSSSEAPALAAAPVAAANAAPLLYFFVGRDHDNAKERAEGLVKQLGGQWGVEMAPAKRLTQEVTLVVHLRDNAQKENPVWKMALDYSNKPANVHMQLKFLDGVEPPGADGLRPDGLEAWVKSRPTLRAPGPKVSHKRKQPTPSAAPVPSVMPNRERAWGETQPLIGPRVLDAVLRVAMLFHMLAEAPAPTGYAEDMMQDELKDKHQQGRIKIPDWLRNDACKHWSGRAKVVREHARRANVCCQLLFGLRYGVALEEATFDRYFCGYMDRLSAVVRAVRDGLLQRRGATTDEAVRILTNLSQWNFLRRFVYIITQAMSQPLVWAAYYNAPKSTMHGWPCFVWRVGILYAFGRPDVVRLVRDSCDRCQIRNPPAPLPERVQYSLNIDLVDVYDPCARFSCSMLYRMHRLFGEILPSLLGELTTSAPPPTEREVLLAAALMHLPRPIDVAKQAHWKEGVEDAFLSLELFEKRAEKTHCATTLLLALLHHVQQTLRGERVRVALPDKSKPTFYRVSRQVYDDWVTSTMAGRESLGELAASGRRVWGEVCEIVKRIRAHHWLILDTIKPKTNACECDDCMLPLMGWIFEARFGKRPARAEFDAHVATRKRSMAYELMDIENVESFHQAWTELADDTTKILKKPTPEHWQRTHLAFDALYQHILDFVRVR